LVRQRDEVAKSRTGLARHEEPTDSASKIVTLTTSPMPSVICGGGRKNTFDALALHWVLGAAFDAARYLAPQPLLGMRERRRRDEKNREGHPRRQPP
jgi:hypothetical protein